MKKKGRILNSRCLFCDGNLEITQLRCQDCETRIESQLAIPPFFRLPQDLQEFVLVFLRCRGNIREVEKALGISYPTVCKRLDAVNELLAGRELPETDQRVRNQAHKRQEILEQVERGELTAQEAAKKLKEIK